ncbi:MAG TPA: hypothetical protein VH988_19565 [Thermoanaerobaculia bacterium]|jgi:hypothetical protein|nr:hypothetical protein [Thermoanaerobaculia bacterium]
MALCYGADRRAGTGYTSTMKGLQRTQRPFLLAAGLIAAGAVLAILGAAAFFVSHHDSTPASPESAEAELSRVRADLADGKPHAAGMRLHSFHTVIFDTRGGRRLVHITMPYWLGRLYAGTSGQFRWLGELTFLDDTEFDDEPIHMTLDEIKRRGPGLLADRRHTTGGQLIAWVE